MKVAIVGAGGRMGLAVARLAQAGELTQIVGAVDAPGSAHLGRDLGEIAGIGTVGVAVSPDLSSGLLGADVVIDFSSASAFAAVVRAAQRAGIALVSGTTGIAEQDHERITVASKKIPILWAPNMSIGVQVLAACVEQAVAALGADYAVEIVEAHHGAKTDAPSGTAKHLLETVQSARHGLRPIYGRQGNVGRRQDDEIGVHALRGGGVIGDHTVHLLGGLERLELTHRALDRDLFAEGALRAAAFLTTQPAGRYTLRDVIA